MILHLNNKIKQKKYKLQLLGQKKKKKNSDTFGDKFLRIINKANACVPHCLRYYYAKLY